jgi:twitching motility protein PilT
MNTKIEALLKMAVANKASDIHLSSEIAPKMRIRGQLVNVTNFEIGSKTEMAELIMSILDEEQKKKFLEKKEWDFSIEVEGSRFRVNIFLQKGMVSAALRIIPPDIPTFEDLSLPEIFNSFLEYKQGFILVTGPTGMGKSTTVASMLNKINQQKASHIVTVEDPVEYLIKPKLSIVSQREVGHDTLDFPSALRSSLRQDPNTVFVGEMRDLETIQSALTIAETGHLVFSTLHTNSAAQTIDRIIDVFEVKEQIRTQLASVITAVISQRLVPTIDGKLTPAFEILVATPAVKNCIREGKVFMIDNIIQTSSDVGMISLESYLAKLVKSGKISEEVATSYALKPADLQNSLRSNKLNA